MARVERGDDLWVLGLLDEALSLGVSSTSPNEGLRGDVDADSDAGRVPSRRVKQTASEVRIDLDDDDQSVLRLLRRHLGPDIEFGTPHRRVHRWLVAGREVLLETVNGRRTCLRIARPAP